MCIRDRTITGLLRQRYGFDRIPVSTEAITVLIERDAAELDVATDLSEEVYDGFGVTLFYVGRRPTVKIARELWQQRSRNNRLRMTLAPRIRPRYAPHCGCTRSTRSRGNRNAVTGRACVHLTRWLTGRNGKRATPALRS